MKQKSRLNFTDNSLSVLMCHALGIGYSKLLSHPELFDQNNHTYQSYQKRRLKHEPIAYIVGSQPFFGLNIKVGRQVLIPRPETEEMVGFALKLFKSKKPKVLDLGTGSGCIAIGLAKSIPGAKVTGIDSSKPALKIARQNAKSHKIKCRFSYGNINKFSKGKYDLIISNPPYIPSADLPGLMPDVRDYEPHSALDGGKDGLDYIRQIILESPKHLNINGCLILEFGFRQGKKVAALAKKHFNKVAIIKDLAGIERILYAQA